jgi:hypothetical protein
MNLERPQTLNLRFCMLGLLLVSALSVPSISFAIQDDSSTKILTNDSTKLVYLVDRICAEVMRAKTSTSRELLNKVGRNIEDRFLINLKINRQTENYQQQIIQLYNRHQDQFICKANTHYGKKHLFKVVVDMQMYSPVLLDYFFKEGREYMFEVNAYEIVGGKPETFLDYLYDIKAGVNFFENYNIPEVFELIELIEDEYGALRGKDLLIAPQNNKESH